MKIGVIKYRKYEERLLLNEHFVIDDLFKIIQEDRDFMWFNIIDERENVLLSTWYPDTEKGAKYLEVAKKVKKEVELLGTTYNAYKSPSYSRRTKVTWKVGINSFRRKKHAQGYVDQTNRRARWAIENYVDRKGNSNENNGFERV